jgi:hypothetical protein
MEIFLMVGILGVSLLSIYLTTKNRKLLLLSSISLISVLLLNFLGILLISGVFKLDISEIFRLIPILSLLLTISNLGILVGFYISKREIKGFKISSIRKEYFTDSVKQSVFFVLLGISTLLFLSPQTVAVVSISLLSTVLTIWLTYWISKYILK